MASIVKEGTNFPKTGYVSGEFCDQLMAQVGPTAVGRDRPLSCSLASQVASVFSAAGRFISAASLGQRERSRSYIARAPWRTFGILRPPTELAIHPSACHRPS